MWRMKTRVYSNHLLDESCAKACIGAVICVSRPGRQRLCHHAHSRAALLSNLYSHECSHAHRPHKQSHNEAHLRTPNIQCCAAWYEAH